MRSTRTFDPVLWLDNLRVVNKEGAFTQAEKDLIDDALSILQRELRKQHTTLVPISSAELATLQEKGEEGRYWPNDKELLRRAVRNCHAPGVPRWAVVRERLAVGSTLAAVLCRRFKLNPDEIG